MHAGEEVRVKQTQVFEKIHFFKRSITLLYFFGAQIMLNSVLTFAG